jgi:hypothetical protein
MMATLQVYSIGSRINLFCQARNEINANSAIFQLYYGENKLIINEMMMKSALF